MIRKPPLDPSPDLPEPARIVRAFDGFGADGSTALIVPGERGGPGGGATGSRRAPLAGPAGFELLAHRLEPGASLAVGGDERDRVLHVVDGPARLVPQGAGRAHDLGTRDTVYLGGAALAGDDRPALTGPEDGAATLLEIRHPGGTHVSRELRIVRSGEVVPVRDRFPVSLAPALNDILSPRHLYPLVGPVGRGPSRFAVRGPDDLVLVVVTTPPGTGPALHVHTLSTEMFVVLRGRYRVTWGDSGERGADLGPLDCIVVPTGVSRAFVALEDDAWLMPIVVGAADETEDIAWLPEIGRRLHETGPWLAAFLATRTSLRIRERRGSA